ncbi:Plus-3 domain/Zinc finger C3HC4 type (RING finger) containing protein [Lotmaria passim]
MLCEEDSRLFEAAKRAQVNRNTVINIIENSRSSEILAGAFVRVLLEMPSRAEGYLVAQVEKTVIGESYTGFSTNANQTTTTHLVIELPRPLSDINGKIYQLNSVSNSTMGEGEFREWLALIRAEQTMSVPTVAELEEVAARIQPFEVNRHRGALHNLASSSNLAVAAGAAAAAPTGSRSASMSNPPQQALSARAQARQMRHNLSASSPSGLMPPLPQPGGRSSAVSMDLPVMSTPAMVNGAAAGPRASNSSNEVEGNANSHPSPNADGANNNNNNGNGNNYNTNRYVRQGTMMSRDFNRNPREDGQASHDMAEAEGSTANLFNGSNDDTNNNSSNGDRYSTSPHTTGNGGPASAAAIPFMTHGAADHRMESEDEEMERRLRQDIMNHLAQECVLFPKDPKGYKLSRLRLLERDMIEYLQHVRDEIQGKQENCIVCMDHVPTVILLPCKHKVMCRLCAPSVSQCPVCRSQITEMFEPEEV